MSGSRSTPSVRATPRSRSMSRNTPLPQPTSSTEPKPANTSANAWCDARRPASSSAER